MTRVLDTFKRSGGAGVILRAATALLAISIAAVGMGLAGGAAGAVTPALGMVCTSAGSGSGTEGDPLVFRLRATTGRISTPDGNSLFMWGFADRDAGDSFQMPGPVLCVEQNDWVRVELTNDLKEPVSLIFPGQTDVTASGDQAGLLTQEAAGHDGVDPGTASYTFRASEPGTYLYESGTEPSKQIQMGLYGALIVRPQDHPDWAYNDPGTAFGEEFLILIHDIDPRLHRRVERGRSYKVTQMTDRYWTINGRSFPDTIADNEVAWLPTQPYSALVRVEATDPDLIAGPPALIRYANAGMVNHPFHPHGNHLKVIARDGRLLGGGLASEVFTKTIGSGQTYDLLFRWTNVENWDPETSPFPSGVKIPSIRNLVFKDDATFYSGDPYLGQQGTLPVGVTSFNECGEFYFPWHSHALNEFQNFDEGFGGLATLVRVDPPGGC